MEPDPITPGEPATAVISVGNDGPGTAADLVLTDHVLGGAEVRSAVGPPADCSVSGARAACRLAELTAGDTTQVEVRLLAAGDPAPDSVSQQIRLSRGETVVATRGTSTPVVSGRRESAALLDRPGAAVLLVTTIALVLAARPGSRGTRAARRAE